MYNYREVFSGVKMIIRNSKVPYYLSFFISAYAVTLWPFIFILDEGDNQTIIHEKIHLRQQVELGIIGFYLLYAGFWLYHFAKTRDSYIAYYEIPFEKEAFACQSMGEKYLKKRFFYAWLNYL
jgi:hypothetical protein